MQDGWIGLERERLRVQRAATLRTVKAQSGSAVANPAPEDPLREKLRAIDVSKLGPEDRIKQVDLLILQTPRPSRSTQPHSTPIGPKPILDPDIDATRAILNQANLLPPEERISYVDQQQGALSQKRDTMLNKARTTQPPSLSPPQLQDAITPLP